MLSIKSSKLLVVAPLTSVIPVAANKQVIHITNTDRIFPVIHQTQPNGIVLDYDYLCDSTEKILRRLTANPFYHKIKIYCYKSSANIKVDGLLKALGVQHFIYACDIKLQPEQNNTSVKLLSEMLETRLINTLVESGY